MLPSKDETILQELVRHAREEINTSTDHLTNAACDLIQAGFYVAAAETMQAVAILNRTRVRVPDSE